jgi:hypothetical protein
MDDDDDDAAATPTKSDSAIRNSGATAVRVVVVVVDTLEIPNILSKTTRTSNSQMENQSPTLLHDPSLYKSFYYRRIVLLDCLTGTRRRRHKKNDTRYLNPAYL